MKRLLSILPILAFAASCSKGGEEAAATVAEKPLCTAAEAGAVTAAKATELLEATRQPGAKGRAACARFKEVIEHRAKAGIPDAAKCRWDDRNSNGNPRFLISLHLTQLRGRARRSCSNLE